MAEAAVAQQCNTLSPEQAAFFHEHGYLHIPQVYSETEIAQMADELDWQIETWAQKTQGWSCLLYTSPSPRDRSLSRMPSSA